VSGKREREREREREGEERMGEGKGAARGARGVEKERTPRPPLSRTMSGRHMLSHMPYSESGAVPATMKSCAVSIAPMLSMPHR